MQSFSQKISTKQRLRYQKFLVPVLVPVKTSKTIPNLPPNYRIPRRGKQKMMISRYKRRIPSVYLAGRKICLGIGSGIGSNGGKMGSLLSFVLAQVVLIFCIQKPLIKVSEKMFTQEQR